MKERYSKLSGFEFSGVQIRSKDIIGITAQQWLNGDSLEQRPTAIFFYYPNKPIEKQWAFRYLGETTGATACATFVPSERWIVMLEDGEVYCVGQGDDGWEPRISAKTGAYFSRIKSVTDGEAIAVGGRRKVFVRRGPGNWAQLDQGLFPQGANTPLDSAGFSDIDGFSKDDLYACGGNGDLWKWNGVVWSAIDIPTDAPLRRIVCNPVDGLVYVTTLANDIVVGRDVSWDLLKQEVTDGPLESIVCYQGQTIVSTEAGMFVVGPSRFLEWDVSAPKMSSFAHLAARDNLLVVAGKDELSLFDGSKWDVVLEPESP